MKSLKLMEQVVQDRLHNEISSLNYESQNRDYEGMVFRVGNGTIRSRLAKKTPTKKGYFLACWQKDDSDTNRPYALNNAPDLLVVNIMDKNKVGQFVFPKQVLAKKRILSVDNAVGKMALRVYPDWEVDLNKTAQMTQTWQKRYFVDLTKPTLDETNLKKLYGYS